MTREIVYLNSKENAYIYNTVNNFMKYNPPCKDCLIQSMCIKDIFENDNDDFLGIKIKICKRLNNFIDTNKYFGSIIPQKEQKK